LTFEPDSKLTRIEARALGCCTLLKSICIGSSIRELHDDWNLDSGVESVFFESGVSLLAMMEAGTAGLKNFRILLRAWDGVMRFPGYSISIIQGVNNLVQLVRPV
jgi:hypothetical protein